MFHLALIALTMLTNTTFAASSPFKPADIPALSLETSMKFTSNYMSKGRTNTNDKPAVSGQLKAYYGDNFNIAVFGSSIDNNPASAIFEIIPAIEGNFGIPWHKARLQYVDVNYPNNSASNKRVAGLIYEIYYDNFTPYVKFTKDLNQKKLEYTELGLKYNFDSYFVSILFADHQTIKASTSAASTLNGKNAEMSMGYKWDHYTFTISTNSFRQDNFSSGTTTKTNTWASISYTS